jgi:sec-independent protein translocase protein TatA
MAPFAFLTMTPGTIILLLIVGIVLFGKQLPGFGHILGKTLKSIQDGVKGIGSDADVPSAPRRDPATLEAPKPPQRIGNTAPKFEDQAASVTPPPPG